MLRRTGVAYFEVPANRRKQERPNPSWLLLGLVQKENGGISGGRKARKSSKTYGASSWRRKDACCRKAVSARNFFTPRSDCRHWSTFYRIAPRRKPLLFAQSPPDLKITMQPYDKGGPWKGYEPRGIRLGITKQGGLPDNLETYGSNEVFITEALYPFAPSMKET